MKKSISIIGGGPSAIFCAAFLDSNKFDITIYEKNKSLGRKFLVAGKGGFNLSHAEKTENFILKYTPHQFLSDSIENFSNSDLQCFLNTLNIPTYIGSSNRVYPEKEIKPIEVLNALLRFLNSKDMTLKTEYSWDGFDKFNNLIFNKDILIKSDYTIFALGGGSWKVTGSNSEWLDYFNKKNINTTPFYPSNCAYKIIWDKEILNNHIGKPFKNISLTCNNKTVKGEVVITKFGLEGNAIYALSPEIREHLNKGETANVFLDLKPMLSLNEIHNKLINNSVKKISERLKSEIKLSSIQIAVLKSNSTKEEFNNFEKLATLIKNLPLRITDSASLDEAISTVGGIDLSEIDSNFELKKLPNHFCIGEMLNYDAPTGGYLLQSCFSMGVAVARKIN